MREKVGEVRWGGLSLLLNWKKWSVAREHRLDLQAGQDKERNAP